MPRIAPTSFVLTGLSNDLGVRVYSFEGTWSDGRHTRHTVSADLALARRYEIRIQELPLLCRKLLEEKEPEQEGRVVFSEEAMCAYSKVVAAAKKPERKRFPFRPGASAATAGEGIGATSEIAAGPRAQ